MNDVTLFAFESDFVATLRCIPMAVRFKLDSCGVKLTLRQWSRLSMDQRGVLLRQACASPPDVTAYREMLAAYVAARGAEPLRLLGEPAEAPSTARGPMPQAVAAFAVTVGARPPSPCEWSSLSVLQRFALIKLSRDNHDNVNFVPALREFGLGPKRREP